MGGLLAQPPQSQLPGPGSPGAAGGIPGLGVLPEGGEPGLGVIQQPALAAGAAARKPSDELSERARAQRVSGVFGGGNDILSQLLAAIAPGAAGGPNVPGSIIGPGAGGIGVGAPGAGALPGAINIDPVVAAVIQAYQQMVGGGADRGGVAGSMAEQPSPADGQPGAVSTGSEANVLPEDQSGVELA